MKRTLVLLFVLTLAVGCGKKEAEPAPSESPEPAARATDSASPEAEPAADETAEPAEEQISTETEEPMKDYSKIVAEMTTDAGTIVMGFYPDKAPKHVANFVRLSESGFYAGTRFHRVIPGFMIQGGDPNTKAGDPRTWGTGGTGDYVPAEFNDISHKRGILSMARSSNPDSASSQFFIMVKDNPGLDRQYSIFGKVLAGMDVVDAIVNAPRNPSNDRPNSPTAIQAITIREMTSDEAAKMGR